MPPVRPITRPQRHPEEFLPLESRLSLTYIVLAKTLYEADVTLTNDILENVIPGQVFLQAVVLGWVPPPDEDGQCSLGEFGVTENVRQDFLELLQPIIKESQQVKKPWVEPTPATIAERFLTATGLRAARVIEMMIPTFIAGSDIQDTAERKAYSRIIKEPIFPNKTNGHHSRLAEIVRTTKNTPYPDLDPVQLTWRIR